MSKRFFAFLVAGLAALPLAAAELAGTTAGGAHFRIETPDGWADGHRGLVIWNHGFDLDPPGPVTDLGPLTEVVLAEGFAAAASSYRQSGWALFQSTRDLRALLQVFRANFGEPSQILLYGASLGGAVTAAAIEQGGLGNVTGALTFCGAMAGSRNWDGALDARLLYDALCTAVPGAAIPGGARGLPRDSALGEAAVEAAANACFGLDRPRGARSAEEKQRLATFLGVLGIPESFVPTVVGYVTLGMADLVWDRGKMRGKLGTDNRSVDYGDPWVNQHIERVRARRGKKRRLERNFTPRGRAGGVKIVSLHTDKDGLVIVENQSAYAAVVPPENLTIGVAVESEPSHCGFTPGEVIAGWESLRAWVGGGPQPTAGDLQESCRFWGNLFGGACRIDPGFRIPDMDARVPPR